MPQMTISSLWVKHSNLCFTNRARKGTIVFPAQPKVPRKSTVFTALAEIGLRVGVVVSSYLFLLPVFQSALTFFVPLAHHLVLKFSMTVGFLLTLRLIVRLKVNFAISSGILHYLPSPSALWSIIHQRHGHILWLAAVRTCSSQNQVEKARSCTQIILTFRWRRGPRSELFTRSLWDSCMENRPQSTLLRNICTSGTPTNSDQNEQRIIPLCSSAPAHHLWSPRAARGGFCRASNNSPSRSAALIHLFISPTNLEDGGPKWSTSFLNGHAPLAFGPSFPPTIGSPDTPWASLDCWIGNAGDTVRMLHKPDSGDKSKDRPGPPKCSETGRAGHAHSTHIGRCGTPKRQWERRLRSTG